VDRGRCCLRCGREGHTIERCGNKQHGPVCEERGLRADHRPGDPSQCRPVPPGTVRIGMPLGGPPPPPDPREGSSEGVERRRAAPCGGIKPADGMAPIPAPRASVEEARGDRARVSPGTDGADPPVEPRDSLRDRDLSPSSSVMEVGEEEGSLRAQKRKGWDEARECREVLAPLPPSRRGGRVMVRRKRKGGSRG